MPVDHGGGDGGAGEADRAQLFAGELVDGVGDGGGAPRPSAYMSRDFVTSLVARERAEVLPISTPSNTEWLRIASGVLP